MLREFHYRWQFDLESSPEQFWPLLADTKARFESITGGRIVEGYSLTEAMMALCINPAKGANKIGSVGMPLPDVSVRIFDAVIPTKPTFTPRARI